MAALIGPRTVPEATTEREARPHVPPGGAARAKGASASKAPEAPPYAVYRVAVELPGTTAAAAISRAHKELRIEIENRLELSSRLLLLEVRVLGPGAADLAEEAMSYPEIVDVEVRPEGPETARYRLTQEMPAIQRVVQRHRILARYPIVLQNGCLRFETVATAAQIRQALRELAERVGPARIEAVRRERRTLGNLGLTPSQEAVFLLALQEGYFDVPRGISVTGLAKRLGRSKSSISEALAKISKRLAEAAVQLALVQLPPSV